MSLGQSQIVNFTDMLFQSIFDHQHCNVSCLGAGDTGIDETNGTPHGISNAEIIPV